MRLGHEDVEAIAQRIVELLEASRPTRWGDVKAITSEFAVSSRWVYANAEVLGGVKVGAGKGAPWRFDIDRVRDMLGAPRAPQTNGHSANGHGTNGSNGHAKVNGHVAPAPPAARVPEAGFDDVGRPLAKLDLKGRFIALNAAFSRIIGYDEAGFSRGASWPSPHDRESFERQSAELARLAAGEIGEVPVMSSYMHGHGLMVQLCGFLELVLGADGGPSHLLLKVERRQGDDAR